MDLADRNRLPQPPASPFERVVIAGVAIDNATFDQALDYLEELAGQDRPCYAVTPNVDHLCQLQDNPRYQEIYARAALVVPDGMPLIWASRYLGRPLKERVAGSDLFPGLCGRAVRRGFRLFFLGGLEGVADKARAVLEERYPGVDIRGTYSPPFGFENDPAEMARISSLIWAARPHILFVGLGAPKQEYFIDDILDRLRVPLSLGIGASFDFVAGTKKRAPAFMRRTGLEWLFRLAQEPRRLFHRYLVRDMAFFRLVLAQRRREKKAAAGRS